MKIHGYFHLTPEVHQSIVAQVTPDSAAGLWIGDCAKASTDSLAQCMHTTVNTITSEQQSGEVMVVDGGNFVTLEWQWRKSLSGPVLRDEAPEVKVTQFYFTSADDFSSAVTRLTKASIWFVSDPGAGFPSIFLRVSDMEKAATALDWNCGASK